MLNSTDRDAVQKLALSTADRIGARLVRDALRHAGQATWLGDFMDALNHQWAVTVKPCGPDLYSGTSGIGWFLARLHQLTGERFFRRTAEAAFEHACSQLNTIPNASRCSMWSGWAGVSWALLESGTTLQHAGWLERGLQLADAVAAMPPNREALDVMSGSAGIIPFLLLVHRRYSRPQALDAAVQHGEALLAARKASNVGCSWTTMPDMPGYENRDLTGLSHGAAGIAVALFELAHATGHTPFNDGASAGIAYEQQFFSPHHNNWPDFRELPPDTPAAQWRYSSTWCHGAPGIALTRMRAWQLTGVAAYREQACAALRATAASVQLTGPGAGNWSLCHGQAGNADVLLVGKEVFGDDALEVAAVDAAIRGITTYEETGLPWPPGVNGGTENPSLMLGSAGTGWFYLRFADRDSIPSVLVPPH